MATRCKTEYDIIRRYYAYKRLLRMRGAWCDVPPVEIYNIDINKTGLITKQDLINCL